jgi:hypothetical protein
VTALLLYVETKLEGRMDKQDADMKTRMDKLESTLEKILAKK